MLPRIFPLILLIVVTTAQAEHPLQGLPEIEDNEIRLFIIRHAETFHNIDPTMDKDAPEYYRITLRGKKQAAALGKLVKDQPIAMIFTSQMTRAKETLKFMEMPPHFEAADDKAFNFLKRGLMPNGEPATFGDWIKMWENNTDPVLPNSENMEIGTRRFIKRLREETDAFGKAVVVVSHGDVIAGVIGSAEGYHPWERWEKSQVPVGSLSVLDLEREGPLYLHFKGFDPVE